MTWCWDKRNEGDTLSVLILECSLRTLLGASNDLETSSGFIDEAAGLIHCKHKFRHNGKLGSHLREKRKPVANILGIGCPSSECSLRGCPEAFEHIGMSLKEAIYPVFPYCCCFVARNISEDGSCMFSCCLLCLWEPLVCCFIQDGN